MGRKKKDSQSIGDLKKFKNRLEKLIDEKKATEIGMTQNKMAKDMDISVGALSAWRNAKSIPEFAYLYKLAKYFKVRVEWLAGLDDNDPAQSKKDKIALSGLEINAIKNLSKITEDNYLASTIIASENFKKLMDTIQEMCEQAISVSNVVDCIENEIRTEAYSCQLSDMIKVLKYGRYELANFCIKILNDILPYDKIIQNAETTIAGTEYENMHAFYFSVPPDFYKKTD